VHCREGNPARRLHRHRCVSSSCILLLPSVESNPPQLLGRSSDAPLQLQPSRWRRKRLELRTRSLNFEEKCYIVRYSNSIREAGIHGCLNGVDYSRIREEKSEKKVILWVCFDRHLLKPPILDVNFRGRCGLKGMSAFSKGNLSRHRG